MRVVRLQCCQTTGLYDPGMTEGRNPELMPDSSDLSGPCVRCGRTSTYSFSGELLIEQVPVDVPGTTNTRYETREREIVLRCAYCLDQFVVVEQRAAESGKFTGIHWWPPLGAGQLSDDVPGTVSGAYDEGVRALSANAPNGATAMFRTALAYIVEDKGSQTAKAKPDLKDKLKQMAAEGGPVAALSEWMTHVRLYGNAGAHPDLFGDVSVEEAQEVSRLVFTMIELLYVMPGQIAARQLQRRS